MKRYGISVLAVALLAGLGLAGTANAQGSRHRGGGNPPPTTTAPAPSAGTHSGNWSGHRGNWAGYRHHHHGYRGSNVYFGVGFGSPFGYGYPYGYGYYPYGYGYGYGYGYDAYSRPVVRGQYVNGGGNYGSVVAQVQERLARAGYYHGSIDGVAGSGTRRAVRAYERNHGLPVDGEIDPELLAQMGLA